MKKQISVNFVFFICSIFIITSGDVYTQQFFPLKVGNKFIYHYSHIWFNSTGGGSLGNDYSFSIMRDTIIYDKVYYRVQSFPHIGSKWIRVDSVTGSLYSYDSTNSCVFYYLETLIDSLLMPLNGTSNICSAMNVTTVNNVTKWGINSIDKLFHRMIGGGLVIHTYRDYNSFFGMYYAASSLYYSVFYDNESYTLKGCVINGVVYGDTVSVGVSEGKNIIPSFFSLKQNYPNPFNPVTKIKFDVAKFYNVKIIVYDISGKELDIIINQPMQPETYEVIWNGEKYSSGIYFYRMLADNYVEMKKMVMLK